MYSLPRVLAVLLLSSAGVCRADDCKPITDALEKMNSTPVHITWSVRTFDAQGKCKMVTVGLSKRNVGRDSSFAADERAPAMDLCRHVGLETFKTQPVQHYYAISEAPDRIVSEFWISVETGYLVRRFASSPASESKWEYDYVSEKVFSLF
jgi:hypothetical protein